MQIRISVSPRGCGRCNDPATRILRWLIIESEFRQYVTQIIRLHLRGKRLSRNRAHGRVAHFAWRRPSLVELFREAVATPVGAAA